jgi:hypothetical protein
MIGWNVYRMLLNGNTVLLDTVFFQDGMESWEVYDSLVNHDGMPPDIVVIRQR